MWYKLPPPWSGITLPGASCVNREKGWHSSECGCSELRFMLFEEWGKGVNSQVEQYFNDCSSSGIFPLVNFDLWKPVSSSEKSANHWHPSENEYKNAVYKLVVKLQDKGLTRDTCLALCDNEPMVYYDWGQYIQYLKWMKQVIGSVFPIVSCNEEYALALIFDSVVKCSTKSAFSSSVRVIGPTCLLITIQIT